MKVSDNLQNDISHAPEWFHKAINFSADNKTIESEGHNVHYQSWGNVHSKKIIFLIHGTGAHKKWWDPIGPQLANDAYVLAIDLPGIGILIIEKTIVLKVFLQLF